MADGSTHPTEALSAYLDDELAGTERAALERHLTGCRPCSDLLHDLRRMTVAAREEEPPAPPADLSLRIQGRIDAAAGVRARPWYRRMPLAAAASLAAMGILWIVWLREPALWTPPSLPGTSQDEMKANEVSQRAEPAADDNRDRGGTASADPASPPAAGAPTAPDATPPGGKAPTAALGQEELDRRVDEGAARLRTVGDLASEARKKEAPADSPARGSADSKGRESKDRDVADRVAPAEPATVGGSRPLAPLTLATPLPAAKSDQTGAAATPASPPAQVADIEEETEASAAAEALQRAVSEQRNEPVPTLAKAQIAEAVEADFARSDMAGPAGTLIFTGASYRITLRPAGALTLDAGGYRCTVAAGDDDEARQAFDAAGREAEKASSRGGDIERTALADAGLTGDVGDDGDDGDDVKADSTPRLLQLTEDTDGRTGFRATGPQGLDDLQETLEALVREHYAARLEAACGPLPAPFRQP